MTYKNPGCMGNYDFDNTVRFARKRFVEGHNTIELMQQASSEREKEEIALVAMLDLDATTVENLQLDCKHADQCKLTNCLELIKKLIEDALPA